MPTPIAPPNAEELTRFIKRAERLLTSAFWGWLTRRRGAADMQRIIAGEWLAHDGLNIDEFEAFCLNLRYFIQPRDGYSIEQVKIVASKWPEAHAELRGQVLRAVEELDARLSGKSLVNIREEGQTTNLELFEVVFYGGIAHENKDKRERFERIVSSGLFAYFAFQAFQSVLFHYRNCILHVAWSAEKYLMREGVIKEE
jgi:hypothetical protein